MRFIPDVYETSSTHICLSILRCCTFCRPKYDVNGALTAVAALKPSNSTDDGEALMKEDTIDICGETTESIKSESVPEVAAPLDEYLVLLPAEMCAADVHRTLTNRTALSKGCEKEAEDGDNDESTVDEKLRARYLNFRFVFVPEQSGTE